MSKFAPIIIAALAIPCFGQASKDSVDYFGQTPPGETATLFAPGIVSTGYDELNAVFSPDGNEFFFSVKLPGQTRHTLVMMERKQGAWTGPHLLPFSGEFSEADPAFNNDGTRLYFLSTRPLPGEESSSVWNIWFVNRTGESWNNPEPLPAPINMKDSHEIHPTLTRTGRLFFSSNRSGTFKLYCMKNPLDPTSEPECIGDIFNPEGNEGDTYVDPDERFLIFSSNRPDSIGRNDLYICFKLADGAWSKAINMGAEVNSETIEYTPTVSPDGKYLLFTSYRNGPLAESRITKWEDFRRIYDSPQNGLGDIYWISTSIIGKLRLQLPDQD